jgi:hypothetical protein
MVPGRSDHFHLDPLDRVSASALRLGGVVVRVGPGAQHDRAGIGSTPGEKEPLLLSLRAGFYLRLPPRRAAVEADLDAVTGE